MKRPERVLVHQVHPVKLAMDIGSSMVSNVLLWRHHLVTGLALLIGLGWSLGLLGAHRARM